MALGQSCSKSIGPSPMKAQDKRLSPARRNYTIGKQVLLAVIHTLKK